MGSYCELRFDSISISSYKSWVPDDFIYLFQESDRRLVPRASEEGEEPEFDIKYCAPRAIVLRRLDLAGYTEGRTRHAFDDWHKSELETWNDYGDWATDTVNVLKSFTYDEWQKRLKGVLHTRYSENKCGDEIDRQMRDTAGGWLFFGSDDLMAIRAMLDTIPDVSEVILDISDLVDGGYIEENELICDRARASDARERSILEPTVIIAEGGTDILVLRRSLQRLFPELSDYFAFFDYENSNADGGVSFVVKFLRAFAAARVNTSILAIFDNDAVGVEAFNLANTLRLPGNIKITLLPEISLAQSYPTIGPQGTYDVDVNGRAASIELFLGRHNLMSDDGTLIPVVWNNYVKRINRYQGVLDDKEKPFARFLAETASHDNSVDYALRYPELVVLWEHIFAVLRPDRRFKTVWEK
jgi:hypothetical protein